MKITFEDSYGKSTIEDIRDDLNIYEIIDLIERLLLAVSYNPDTIKDGFISKVEEYEENK